MEITQLKEILEKEEGRFGDRHCELTVIGDHQAQVDRFTDALKSCFLTDDEIELWKGVMNLTILGLKTSLEDKFNSPQ